MATESKEQESTEWDPYEKDQELGRRQHVVDLAFLYECDAEVAGRPKEDIKREIMGEIRKYDMLPFYETLCARFGWRRDADLVREIGEKNTATLKQLQDAQRDAEENQGDLEVIDAIVAKADFFGRIGDKAQALDALDEASKKPMSAGGKIDLVLHKIRLGFFHMDLSLVKQTIDKAAEMVESGGDWDRRNRLKVYEAVYLLLMRDISKASSLFLDSVATFTSYELLPFERFILYTVLTGLLSLDRATLKKRVVDSPEILSAVGAIPHLADLLNSLYECRYADFFQALVDIFPQLQRDRYFAPYARIYLREVRVQAYSQFLQSYRSVTLSAMASAFGLGEAFIDKELSRFIAAGRLNAKIDKVAGILERTQPDVKNTQYQKVLHHGDALLNRVQKLARVINT